MQIKVEGQALLWSRLYQKYFSWSFHILSVNQLKVPCNLQQDRIPWALYCSRCALAKICEIYTSDRYPHGWSMPKMIFGSCYRGKEWKGRINSHTGILWQIVCVVRITVTKNKLYWCHGYLWVKNADCRPDTKCRLQTSGWIQNADWESKEFFRLVCDNMSSYNLPSVTQSLLRDQLSRLFALLWNTPGPFLDQNRS